MDIRTEEGEKHEINQNVVENKTIDANFTFFDAVHTHLKACGDVLPPSTSSFPDTVEAPSLGVHRATTIASADNSLVKKSVTLGLLLDFVLMLYMAWCFVHVTHHTLFECMTVRYKHTYKHDTHAHRQS